VELDENGKVLISVRGSASLRSILMNHTITHRGQLSVYLRMLGFQAIDLPVPARTKLHCLVS